MSTNTKVKKAMLSIDKTLVDENNLEIPPNSIIHCLGLLFQVTNAGLRHIVGKKIDIAGAKTMVFSDHKPLKNFSEGGMNITKLDRWSLGVTGI